MKTKALTFLFKR